MLLWKKSQFFGLVPGDKGDYSDVWMIKITVDIQCVSKKGIDKKLLIEAAHDFNSQFLNLFGFGISVSFVWCII